MVSMSVEDATHTPVALVGSIDEIVDELIYRRDRWGVGVLGGARSGDRRVRAGGGPTERHLTGVAAGERAPRIAILGGTFDPIHIGHLVAAVWTRHALDIDRVLLMVANEPWQKTPTRRITPAEDRFAMAAAAVDGIEWLEASRMEIERGGPSYTIDTARELTAATPGVELFLVVGADVASQLQTWHHVDELVPLVTLVVVDRGGVAAVPALDHWTVEHVKIPSLEISSSELRARLAEGDPVDFLVPAAAVDCIFERRLYSEGR